MKNPQGFPMTPRSKSNKGGIIFRSNSVKFSFELSEDRCLLINCETLSGIYGSIFFYFLIYFYGTNQINAPRTHRENSNSNSNV